MPIIQTDKPMRPRSKADHYPTAYPVCAMALSLIRHDGISRILDPGAGTGVWGQAARQLWSKAVIIGVELRNVPPSLYYDQWIHRSFKGSRRLLAPVDLVMGNPPYIQAEAFVTQSIELVLPLQGQLIQLLPLSFLAGQGRRTSLYKRNPPNVVYVMSRRPSFIHTGEKAGNTDATEYGVYVWDFRLPRNEPIIRWVDWEDAQSFVPMTV